MSDLETRLTELTARIANLVARLEVRVTQLDRLDDRLLRAEKLIAVTWMPGAIAGAVAGGVVWVLVMVTHLVGMH
jgi:hypothetical protein